MEKEYNKKLLRFSKGSLKKLKNDDFVVRFVASPKNEIKIVKIFIYVTYEYLRDEVLDINIEDEKEIDKFFEEELEEWKEKISVDEILKKKNHYLIYGNIFRLRAKKYIEAEYRTKKREIFH